MITNIGLYKLDDIPEEYHGILDESYVSVATKETRKVRDYLDLCFVMPVEQFENFQENYSKGNPLFTNPKLEWVKSSEYAVSHKHIIYFALKVNL